MRMTFENSSVIWKKGKIRTKILSTGFNKTMNFENNFR